MACVLGNQWLIQSTGSGSNSIGQIKPAVNVILETTVPPAASAVPGK